jgi:hypothetical protein
MTSTINAALFASRTERRVVPAPVLVELDYLLARELGGDQFAAFLDAIARGASWTLNT